MSLGGIAVGAGGVAVCVCGGADVSIGGVVGVGLGSGVGRAAATDDGLAIGEGPAEAAGWSTRPCPERGGGVAGDSNAHPARKAMLSVKRQVLKRALRAPLIMGCRPPGQEEERQTRPLSYRPLYLSSP